MGRDKSRLMVEGTTLAVRTATLLTAVADPVIEVGPGRSGLPATLEDPPGEGPLAAISAGRRALRERGCRGSALVVACDMPFLTERLLRCLAEWESPYSVVPIVGGRLQPLCAKWGCADLDGAEELVRRGARSLEHLSSQPGVVLLDESQWRTFATAEQFSDVDSVADLERLGLPARFAEGEPS